MTCNGSSTTIRVDAQKRCKKHGKATATRVSTQHVTSRLEENGVEGELRGNKLKRLVRAGSL